MTKPWGAPDTAPIRIQLVLSISHSRERSYICQSDEIRFAGKVTLNTFLNINDVYLENNMVLVVLNCIKSLKICV